MKITKKGLGTLLIVSPIIELFLLALFYGNGRFLSSYIIPTIMIVEVCVGIMIILFSDFDFKSFFRKNKKFYTEKIIYSCLIFLIITYEIFIFISADGGISLIFLIILLIIYGLSFGLGIFIIFASKSEYLEVKNILKRIFWNG